jgi:hypothetical protein
MSRWWLLLVALLALLPSCVVSPTPWPIPEVDKGVAADSGVQPHQDGALADSATTPDMGLRPDLATPDAMPGPDRGTGDGMPGDGITGDWMPGDWQPGDSTYE